MATATKRERALSMQLERPPTLPETLDANAFLFLNGRLPRVDDDPPAWAYRGWLLYYLQAAEIQLNGENSRWAYYIATMERGQLLDDRAIPEIRFGEPDRTVFSKMQRWTELVGYDCGGWSDFTTLLDWLCYGLAVPGYTERPRVYKGRDAEEALYRAVDLSVFLKAPYDYFGAHISEHKSRGFNPSGFYPTPHQVCELMDRMNFCDAEKSDEDTRIRKVMRSVCRHGPDAAPREQPQPPPLRPGHRPDRPAGLPAQRRPVRPVDDLALARVDVPARAGARAGALPPRPARTVCDVLVLNRADLART